MNYRRRSLSDRFFTKFIDWTNLRHRRLCVSTSARQQEYRLGGGELLSCAHRSLAASSLPMRMGRDLLRRTALAYADGGGGLLFAVLVRLPTLYRRANEATTMNGNLPADF